MVLADMTEWYQHSLCTTHLPHMHSQCIRYHVCVYKAIWAKSLTHWMGTELSHTPTGIRDEQTPWSCDQRHTWPINAGNTFPEFQTLSVCSSWLAKMSARSTRIIACFSWIRDLLELELRPEFAKLDLEEFVEASPCVWVLSIASVETCRDQGHDGGLILVQGTTETHKKKHII